MISDGLRQRELKRLATRDRVLEAAEDLFYERGYEHATIQDIADRAFVSVGTVIANGDKETLLATVVEPHLRALLAEASIEPNTVDRIKMVLEWFSAPGNLGRDYLAVVLRHPERMSVMTELSTLLDACAPDRGLALAPSPHLSFLGAVAVVAAGATPPGDALRQIASLYRPAIDEASCPA